MEIIHLALHYIRVAPILTSGGDSIIDRFVVVPGRIEALTKEDVSYRR